ncbi:efflux RND transporter periplasmic adaptor subunit [Pseudodesulfovibrio senegalensis]|jgi:RND family efflux transporter MFP subunit|uniref:Efflux RND transporter periplasmic adaptor subunit n=1 Tax=Pseudodesulfovibrio senegalensis TaxID=1721087 RepID=A0A6N6N183_9BACT|nr:efflux RND transporter periplasmic adaptor subunit [Pseudodesulfovibrio senegalensis]KAB1437213.1 efflux RND transporter periplasmic adaptor subunit [Pseudodesulfovibrio senegalensis]
MTMFKTMALSGLCLAMLTCGACRDKVEKKAEVIRPVVTYTIPDIMRSREWSTSGTAKDALETALSFRVGGTIVSLPVKVGQRVEKGDLVAALDPTDFRLEVRRAEASLKDLKAELNNSRLNYQRLKTLVDKAVISRSEYDSAFSSYESLLARVEAQEDQVSIARRNLSYATLNAPVAGIISTKPAEVHRNVAAGETIATLNSKGDLEIEIGVPDRIVPYVEVGQSVSVEFDVFQDVTLAGAVKEVGVEAQDSSTFPVTVTLQENDPRIRSGMVAEVTFDFARIAEMQLVSIPVQAMFGKPDNTSWVWVLDTDTMTVQERAVEPGMPTRQGTAIKKGLNPGDVVVVRGVHSLKNGQKVRMMQ